MNNFNKIETVSLTEIYMNFEPMIGCVLAGSCYGCVLSTPVSNTFKTRYDFCVEISIGNIMEYLELVEHVKHEKLIWYIFLKW